MRSLYRNENPPERAVRLGFSKLLLLLFMLAVSLGSCALSSLQQREVSFEEADVSYCADNLVSVGHIYAYGVCGGVVSNYWHEAPVTGEQETTNAHGRGNEQRMKD